MRIDAYNQISQVYKANNKTKISKAASVKSASDQLQISDFGKDLQIAKQAVAQTPDVREQLVADYKARIQSGSYDVNNETFANKLLEKFGE